MGKYLRYRLSKNRVLIVFYAVINFLSVLLPSMMFNRDMKELAAQISVAGNGLAYGTLWDFIIQLLVVMIPLNIIIITVSTVRSLRFYHKRSEMDTLGCLPISYRDRFWGDFLGGIIPNFISYIPFAVAALFFIEDMKEPIKYIAESKFKITYYLRSPAMLTWLLIMMFIVYIGVYAVTTFVSSCCGKLGNAVLFSLIAMIVLPGIFCIYGDHYFSQILGVDSVSEVSRIICILPPLGPLVSEVIYVSSKGRYSESSNIVVMDNPLYYAVYALFIAAFIVGAFYIGKRRRAENVGEGFVFGGAYHALIITFLIALIGFSMLKFDEFLGGVGILFTLLLTFIVYAALEFAQHKNVRMLWKTAVRFAVVFGVCFGFYTVIKSTDSFNAYKILPSKNSVKSVELSGQYFFTMEWDQTYTMTSDEFISGILSEHKALIKSKELITGDDLKITYVMNNGHRMTRSYAVSKGSDEDPIKDFSDAAKALPDFEWIDFGIPDDLSNYVVTYNVSHVSGDTSIVDGIIKRDKLPELIELLENDIKVNYNKNYPYEKTNGHLTFSNKDNDDFWLRKLFEVNRSYTETYKFLSDRENYTDDLEEDEEMTYRFLYTDGNVNATVVVSSKDTSEAAQLLLFYLDNYALKSSNGSNSGTSTKIRIVEQNYNINYRIELSVEEDVIKAILELFREQNLG